MKSSLSFFPRLRLVFWKFCSNLNSAKKSLNCGCHKCTPLSCSLLVWRTCQFKQRAPHCISEASSQSGTSDCLYHLKNGCLLYTERVACGCTLYLLAWFIDIQTGCTSFYIEHTTGQLAAIFKRICKINVRNSELLPSIFALSSERLFWLISRASNSSKA